MLSVIVLGFKTEELIQIPEIAWAFHDSSASAGLSGREYALIIEKMVDRSDAILVNLNVEVMSTAEIIIMHQAFKTNKFILSVGSNISDPLIHSLPTQQVNDLKEALQHMQTHYMLISQG
ncbi:hypothetical protein J2T16_002692 [Paenibacillus intestini]|nr:hypothetical protein [Paenibacillus xylanexedens]MDP9699791.1 hypothetical protein [Paenibacillus intestini]